MSDNNQYIIQTDNLTRKFKNTVAVNGLNLSIWRGEIFGLVGPDGAGKTTTIRLLVAITMVVSALAALTLLPALMLLVKLRLRPGTAPSGAESAKTPAGRNAGGSG